ncbi:MarR family transcriptional regulator [Actinoplanes sp. TBRC 11911]|uniref:MarR family winged helix-turn-helix transcriptional regulator n=1 Tax=Actinoplanes sp. TBRC 11911 TaxID=2729386 RepID=UPI00145DA1A1|nr:MarR family transcriptional regulator [Actinoplanes sp. TBRC 11911]NMO50396.1 MarR family transcriptional regulator [Actinoplanes sp. TBRC 11911]
MRGDERLDAEQLAAYFTLSEVGSLLEQAVTQQLRDEGDLSPIQFKILAGLDATPGGAQRMTDIADRIVYSRSGFSYQAGQLEQRGLIARSPAKDDERSTLIHLTDAGRDLLNRVMPEHVALVKRLLFDAMPPTGMQDLQRALGPVRDRLREAPPRSARPRARQVYKKQPPEASP